MRVKTACLDSFPCFIGFLSWIRSDVLFLNFDQYSSKKSSYIKENRRGRLPGRPESPDVLFIGTRRKRSPAEKYHESISVYLNAVPTRTWNSAVRRTCLHRENAIIRCRYDAGTELCRQMNLSARRKRPPAPHRHRENAITRCRYDAGTELFRQMNLSTRRKRPPAPHRRIKENSFGR